MPFFTMDTSELITDPFVDPFLDFNPELFTQIDSLVELNETPNPAPNRPTRFSQPLSAPDFQKVVDSRIPKNTQQSTTWSVMIFREWRSWRNFHEDTKKDTQWPIPALDTMDYNCLDYWLARFIVEVRRKDGEPYEPGTLTSIAAGLQRHIRDVVGHLDVWLLKKDNLHFKKFRDALDSRRKILLAVGIGTTPVQADPVTNEDEVMLWETGTLSFESSKGLSYAVYFYNCKVFGFRCKDEHMDLTPNQYVFGNTQDGREYIQYNGKLAKNVTGCNDSKATPRKVRHFSQPDNPRCVVALFRKYLSLIPPTGRFYRRPLANIARLGYSSQYIGIHKLEEYLEQMFKNAKIDTTNRNITGHSGKVNCCTRLYEANFDEQSIMSRSGHRSNAVRAYKRPSQALQQQISDTLQPPMPKKVACTATTNTLASQGSSCNPSTMKKEPSSTPSCTPVIDTNPIMDTDPDMLTLHLPAAVKRVTLMKNGIKLISFDI